MAVRGLLADMARVREPLLGGSVSTCASWRIAVVVGYAAAFRGMKRDAVPGMSINGRQASV
jgi:hypothetical protein